MEVSLLFAYTTKYTNIQPNTQQSNMTFQLWGEHKIQKADLWEKSGKKMRKKQNRCAMNMEEGGSPQRNYRKQKVMRRNTSEVSGHQLKENPPHFEELHPKQNSSI